MFSVYKIQSKFIFKNTRIIFSFIELRYLLINFTHLSRYFNEIFCTLSDFFIYNNKAGYSFKYIIYYVYLNVKKISAL